MPILKLFWSFFQIGLFSFGGGYAAMPLIQNQVVDANGWLGMTEFMDLVTISQMTPGPIAINSATFVGIRIAGVSGALAATLGCVLPSGVIVIVLARLYLKYRNMTLLQEILNSLRPAVVAMIASSGISILAAALWGEEGTIRLSQTNWRMAVLFGVCVLLLKKRQMNPIWVMVLAGIINMAVLWIGGRIA